MVRTCWHAQWQSAAVGQPAAGGDAWGYHSKCWVCWGSTWICSTWFLLCSLAITNSDGSRACWGFHQDTVACTAALSGSSLRCLAGLLACAAVLSEEQQHWWGCMGRFRQMLGLLGWSPCCTKVDGTARQAAVFQPHQQLVYCHPAGCVLPSAQQHHQLALW